MQIKCISTGSKGNCYLLKNSLGDTLILDCGIKLEDIITNPSFPKLSKIMGCLCTHSHSDHNKCLHNIKKFGIKTLTYENIITQRVYNLGCFDVVPFKVKHNVDCYGFIIISNIDKEEIIYCTDMNELPYVKNIKWWLIECNYTDKLIDDNILHKKNKTEEDLSYLVDEKAKKNHMGLKKLFEYFANYNISKEKILLCHTSDKNCDRTLAKTLIGYLCQRVEIVENGGVYDL